MTYEGEQEVEVHFDGCWQAARILRTHEWGADVMIGLRGVRYIRYANIRQVQR